MSSTAVAGQVRHARARAAASVAFGAQGLGFATVLTHLPALKDRWGLDDLAVTLIMFCVALLAGAGSVVAAALAARVGSGTTLRVALVTAAVGLVVAAIAPAFVMFCIGIGIYGVALGLVDATTNMQAVALEAEYGRSILTSFHAAWSVGGIVGALATAGASALGWGLPAAFLPVAILMALVAGAPFLAVSTVDGTPAAEADPGTPAAEADPGTPAQPAPPRLAADAGGTVPWRALGLLGAALVLFYVADSAAASWSSIYLTDVLAASAAVAPLAYGAYQGTSLVSRVLGDLVVRRWGPVAVVRTAAGTGIVGLVFVIAAPGPAVAILGFAVLGLGLAVVAPLTFAAAGRLAGDGSGRRQRIDALVARLNQFNYLGFVLGGVVTGLISTGSGLRGAFIVPLVAVVLILPLARAFATRRPPAKGHL